MAYIKSRKHAVVRALPPHALTTAATATLMAIATPALAQTSGGTLGEVKVEATTDVYKADSSASPKFTQPLVDTPQTVQIIKKEILTEQGAGTLMEALRNTPGITMQLGENGNSSQGDAFQLRGFSTQTSTFLDGIRDLGAITRDTFNLEQIEVVKGPAGADIGRGGASGYINQISKLPSLENGFSGTVGVGTASKLRTTADFNRKLGETSAIRLNVMAQDSGVDGRDYVENKGYGIAPSIAFGLNTPTRLYLYSYHVRNDNLPDGGIPTIGMPGFYNATGVINSGARVRPENFYGSVNDYEKSEADMFTAKIEHDLGAGTTISNISRYGKTKWDRVTTGVSTGATGIVAVNPADPSTWTVNRSRQRTDQVNEILANQTNLRSDFDLGGIKHSVSAGVEFLYERQKALGFSATGISNPAANLYNPNPRDNLGTPYLSGAYSDGSTTTAALYAFDTLKFNEQWLLNGGLRFEHYNTKLNGATVVTATNAAQYPGVAVGALGADNRTDSDNLLSWKIGTVYKPAENGSLYAAYATSYTPPGSGNFVLSGSTTSADSPTLDPQKTTNLEFGTKWELFDKKLTLNGAVFRTENDKQVTYDALSASYFQSGKTRVQGVELSVVGEIARGWQVMAGIAKMHTRQLNQVSNTGVVTDAVRWSPDLTATLWTTYTVGGWTFGGGARHVSEQKRVVTAGTLLATQPMPSIPSYWVADAMASYAVNKNLTIRFNVNNIFDEEYIQTLNNGGTRMTLGAPRSAMLSATYMF